MSVARVLNMHHTGLKPVGAVYIGRPSKWGNPFVIGPDGDRAEVVRRYQVWVEREIEEGRLDLEELRGLDLVCWCAPLPCHGDVLVRLAEEAS